MVCRLLYATQNDYIKFGNKSEDCLYLNLFRPANVTTGAKLPVMLFLYGGSWISGGSSFIVYGGGRIVTEGNVILVTSNYRLGPFGFLGSSVCSCCCQYVGRSRDLLAIDYGMTPSTRIILPLSRRLPGRSSPEWLPIGRRATMGCRTNVRPCSGSSATLKPLEAIPVRTVG